MAGIYLHIPFCKQACHYCDFHFSTSKSGREELIEAMHKELQLRKMYLQGEKIETIYFGGGTPSMLETDEIKRLLDRIHELFEVDKNAEITLEANPDDLTEKKITELKSSPVNRLSIGIQSFRDEDLEWMNRAHCSSQADYAVKAAQDNGFENITIDLIYSIPGMSNEDWKQNLHKAIDLRVNHISSYSLTIEPKTVFGSYQQRGKLMPMEQERSGEQFMIMVEELSAHGFEHYEISNFCQPGHESKHNTSYWKGKKYLGIGPSAHSYDGISRQWNVANNPGYTRSLLKGELNFEREELDQRTVLNEYIMTGMRTKWGIDLKYIQSQFHFELKKEYEDYIEEHIRGRKMMLQNDILTLSTEGMLMADRIASDLFIIEEKT